VKAPDEPGAVRASLALAGFIGLPLLVGAAGASVTADAVRGWYLTLARPPGVPPSAVFPVVWTTLYIMMGLAAWRAWCRPDPWPALLLWGAQLLANALWSPAFFGLRSPGLGLVVLALLLPLLVATILALRRRDAMAAALMLPYLLWTLYATYLNIGFRWLNP
jgi:benzodiazapine receptor